MNKLIIISLIILEVLFLSCSKKQDDLPEELSIAFEYIEEHWDEEQIETFKESPEIIAVINEHFGMGLFLRNTLIRNNDNSMKIQAYFSEFGITHFDNMSGILLTSYHRWLNNKEINMEQQVKKRLDFWDFFEENDQKQDSIPEKGSRRFLRFLRNDVRYNE